MTAIELNDLGALIPDMALHDRIKEAVEKSGKTRAEIARLCGVTNAAVTQWLDGTTKSLKAEKALALERATGYRANWLSSGKGPKLLADPAEPYWPFTKVPIERFLRLTDDDKGYVQRRLLQAIQECEIPVNDGQPAGGQVDAPPTAEERRRAAELIHNTPAQKKRKKAL
jgi:transcriptional regulator with XRE-family HTH domain